MEALNYFRGKAKSQTRNNVRRSYFHSRRLEFLGDTVFNLYVFDTLMAQYPPRSHTREIMEEWTYLTANNALGDLALIFKIDQEMKNFRRNIHLTSLFLADVLEALVGAVYLDGGYQEAKKLVTRLVNGAAQEGLINGVEYKSSAHSGIFFPGLKQINSLRHPQYAFYNKKLRFLGARVLILFVTETVLRKYPNKKIKDVDEKRRSLMRSIYQMDLGNLSYSNRSLLLKAFKILWRNGKQPDVASGAFNFLVGVAYLDGGYQKAKELVARLVEKTDFH